MTSTNDILADTSNRQYPLPEREWKYFQEWHNTLFFHWKVEKSLLEKYIPEEIELDTIDDFAWVSLVAFEVRNMQFRYLPPIPYISYFQEINVRTYVIKDGIPGIYFFSIETNKFIEVLLTRFIIGLPYQKSKIKWTTNTLWSDNRNSNYHLDTKYKAKTAPIEKTTLDFWLTERHSLYEYCNSRSNRNNKVCRFDIHHKEWKLIELDAKIIAIKYNAGNFKLNINPDKLHFAKKVDTILWGKVRV